jgi:hypothetical protein
MPIAPSSTPKSDRAAEAPMTEARALRDQLNTQYPPELDPPEVGEWRAYMSPLGFRRVDRETPEGLECAAATLPEPSDGRAHRRNAQQTRRTRVMGWSPTALAHATPARAGASAAPAPRTRQWAALRPRRPGLPRPDAAPCHMASQFRRNAISGRMGPSAEHRFERKPSEIQRRGSCDERRPICVSSVYGLRRAAHPFDR